MYVSMFSSLLTTEISVGNNVGFSSFTARPCEIPALMLRHVYVSITSTASYFVTIRNFSSRPPNISLLICKIQRSSVWIFTEKWSYAECMPSATSACHLNTWETGIFLSPVFKNRFSDATSLESKMTLPDPGIQDIGGQTSCCFLFLPI